MSRNFNYNKLFIFEIANNHMGDLRHGIEIIRQVHKVCKKFDFTFAFKLQYRNLGTFIHPDFRGGKDVKYVRRFEETRLEEKELKVLSDEIKNSGFLSVCTPFDEVSVDFIEKHNFDILKVGSCSLTDWPLLECLVRIDKPIIVSLGAGSVEQIDKVVAFFEHRKKNFCLMHCVAEYPTAKSCLELNQIDFIRQRYPNIAVGYSTHEDPDNFDAIKVAIAKGAVVFERHVGIATSGYKLNQYSSTPEQIEKWLTSAKDAFIMCGHSDQARYASQREIKALKELKRGVFAKGLINKGQMIGSSNTFLAIPNIKNQLLANDLSKYTEFYAKKRFKNNGPIMLPDIDTKNLREKVLKIIKDIKDIIIESKVSLSDKVDLELSHHYGIDNFQKFGAVIISCINREYCKKIIVMLPGQRHPSHYHNKKEETFHILYGDMKLNLNGSEKNYQAGEMVIIERGSKHSFSSKNGAVFEEISTTYFADDSFYDDMKITNSKNRKTYITLWFNWRTKPVL
jgi:sialic acid synthase SpsE/mannose-6-phosphate isomerase-like protein (cupin superfamily)